MTEEGHMQQHLCSCAIDIAEEKLTVVVRGPTDPVPWPEIRVLMEVHGEQAITDIKPVALGPRESPNREKERMVLKYGRDEVEKVYAGKSFNMEFFMPGWPIDPAKGTKKAQNARPKKTQYIEPELEDRV